MTPESVSQVTANDRRFPTPNQACLLRTVALALCLAAPLPAQNGWGQAPNQNMLPAMQLRPAQPARGTRLPQLNDLTQVKLVSHAGEVQLIMMLESFRTEKRTGRVIKQIPQERTRMVPDGQGGQVEQAFTIHVAVAEEGEIEVKIPAGRKPLAEPASQFRFLDLSGNELTLEAATEKLRTLQPAFLLDRFIGELPEMPEIYRQALHASCLVIVTEEAIRDLGQRPLEGVILPAKNLEPRIVPR